MKPNFTPLGTGVGLRLPHIAEVVATRPSVAWLEIHPENFLHNPHATELLLQLAEHYPISVHTVGLSVGSAAGIDRSHLKRARALVDKVNPMLVSGHLAWSTHPGEYLNDLLPLPYTEETLRLVADHINQVQDGLGRTYLLENPSNYFGFKMSTMTEPEFLSELARRTQCQLLCDVSNVYLSAHNMRYDARQYLAGMPGDAIGELHLGGFSAEPDQADPGSELLVDAHATPVADPAWALYSYAVSLFGPKPTLIEWDNDIPTLQTLLDQAARADSILAANIPFEASHAAAR